MDVCQVICQTGNHIVHTSNIQIWRPVAVTRQGWRQCRQLQWLQHLQNEMNVMWTRTQLNCLVMRDQCWHTHSNLQKCNSYTWSNYWTYTSQVVKMRQNQVCCTCWTRLHEMSSSCVAVMPSPTKDHSDVSDQPLIMNTSHSHVSSKLVLQMHFLSVVLF